MSNNVLKDKSYEFALLIVKLFQKLSGEQKEFILSKQLLRSGISIDANVEEASGGISRKEFTAKLQISFKEAKETRYWLRLLNDSGYLTQEDFDKALNPCDELLRIMSAILKTTKSNTNLLLGSALSTLLINSYAFSLFFNSLIS